MEKLLTRQSNGANFEYKFLLTTFLNWERWDHCLNRIESSRLLWRKLRWQKLVAVTQLLALTIFTFHQWNRISTFTYPAELPTILLPEDPVQVVGTEVATVILTVWDLVFAKDCQCWPFQWNSKLSYMILRQTI